MNMVPQEATPFIKKFESLDALCSGSLCGEDMDVADAFIEKFTAYAGPGGTEQWSP